MKKIEKQIEHYAHLSVPNVLDEVLKQKGSMQPTRKPRFGFKLAGATLMVPLLLLMFFILAPTQEIAASTVTIDFETAITFEVDESNRVLDILGGNEAGNAFVLLIKDSLDYKDETLTEVLPLIYTLASENDYLKDEATVFYTVESDTQEVLDTLSAQMAHHFENLPAMAKPFKEIYETQGDASDLLDSSISIPRMHAIKAILDASNLYTFDELKTLSNEALIQRFIELELELPMRRMPGMRP